MSACHSCHRHTNRPSTVATDPGAVRVQGRLPSPFTFTQSRQSQGSTLHSFNNYLPSTCWGPGSWDPTVNKRTNPCLQESDVLVRETAANNHPMVSTGCGRSCELNPALTPQKDRPLCPRGPTASSAPTTFPWLPVGCCHSVL